MEKLQYRINFYISQIRVFLKNFDRNQSEATRLQLLSALFIIFIVLFVIPINDNRQKGATGEKAKEEVKALSAKVAKLIDIPIKEEPRVATVTDAERLREQPFFRYTQSGDKVLIYPTWKKAVLYRPLNNKIVEMTNISSENGSEVDPNPDKVGRVKIAIYTMTNNAGTAKIIEDKIKKNFYNVLIVEKGETVKKDYTGIYVIDISGYKKDAAASLASILGGQVGSLITGERKPIADILVIIPQ